MRRNLQIAQLGGVITADSIKDQSGPAKLPRRAFWPGITVAKVTGDGPIQHQAVLDN